MAAPGGAPDGNDPDGGRPLSGTERAVAGLRERILGGRLVPGQRLVEVDLTREIGVGRNSLREAFSRLRSEGLLTLEPHRGASVRRFSGDDIAGLYEIREVLEGLAARRAAERIDRPGHADRLAAASRSLSDARPEDPSAASALAAVDREVDEAARFHTCLVELADDPQLTTLLDRLHLQALVVQRRLSRRDGVDMCARAYDEHAGVADAVAAGDGARAEHLMRDHVRRVRERFLALPGDDAG